MKLTKQAIVTLLSIAGLGVFGPLFARESSQGEASRSGTTGWSGLLRGGYVHESSADLDGGGAFEVDRFFIQGGPAWRDSGGTTVSLALGYGQDDYQFSGGHASGGWRPWGDIETFRLSVPVRWSLNEKWAGFVLPTIRSTAEKGADRNDAITGGGFLGFSYRFGPNLTLGPGIGVLTRLEDDADVFPVLFLDWRINDQLRLETGRGLGATRGPGLQLRLTASPRWEFTVGARSERLRFRLDEKGSLPNGIGEDRALPVYIGAAYRIRGYQLALVAGTSTNGELRLEDERGGRVEGVDYDSSGFVGITFSGRF